MTNEITWDELLSQTKASPRRTVGEANDQLVGLREFVKGQKPKAKRANHEMELVRAILDYLEKRGDVHCFRANAGKVKTDKGHWFQGVPDGTSDIIGFHFGTARFIAIEAKHGANQPTEAQMNFLDMVDRAGGIAFPAWSVEQVAQRLDVYLDTSGR